MIDCILESEYGFFIMIFIMLLASVSLIISGVKDSKKRNIW